MEKEKSTNISLTVHDTRLVIAVDGTTFIVLDRQGIKDMQAAFEKALVVIEARLDLAH